MIFLFEYINIPASGCNYNLDEWCLFYLLLSWIFAFPLTDVVSINYRRRSARDTPPAKSRLARLSLYVLVWEQALYLIHRPWRERLLWSPTRQSSNAKNLLFGCHVLTTPCMQISNDAVMRGPFLLSQVFLNIVSLIAYWALKTNSNFES
jgi:hypothetical protein